MIFPLKSKILYHIKNYIFSSAKPKYIYFSLSKDRTRALSSWKLSPYQWAIKDGSKWSNYCENGLWKSAIVRSHFLLVFEKVQLCNHTFVALLKSAIIVFCRSLKKCDCAIALFCRFLKKCDHTFCCSLEKCNCAIELFVGVWKSAIVWL